MFPTVIRLEGAPPKGDPWNLKDPNGPQVAPIVPNRGLRVSWAS